MTTLTPTADAIREIANLANCSNIEHAILGTHHLVLPPEYKHVNISAIIEESLPAPSRRTGTAILGDLDSLIKYAVDQGAETTGYVYANIEQRSITYVFNDIKNHKLNGWRDHRAVYKAELSREFTRWIGNNQKQMEQEDFAIFIEDNISDIPLGEELLKVALSLQAKTEVNFSSCKRLDNGQVQFQYTENLEARAGGGAIEIPREFYLGIRIFKNGDGYELKARLKYRLNSGKLKFWYELDRPENAVEDAFNMYINKLRAESGYTVLIGQA